MSDHLNAGSGGKPIAHAAKQAIVVIHGMGEQRPMDTIKDFADAVWKNDPEITANYRGGAAELWSKPDLRTGSFELRRITTRESIATATFPEGVRSDFYELYWADLSGGSTWSHVRDWVVGLLLRNPFTQVPRGVMLAWIALWIVALLIIILAIATTLPATAALGSFQPWQHIPLRWLSGIPSWALALVATALGVIAHNFIVPYFGRVVRYTQARPDNIAARKNVRERGLNLLKELHRADYERIVVVGHSLGAIVAYDLISYLWADRKEAHSVREGTPEFGALRELVRASEGMDKAPGGARRDELIESYRDAQTTLCRLLRTRKAPATGETDARWLITDLVTLGCPLTHAEFLLAKNKDDFEVRKEAREFPTSPPMRELLDAKVLAKARTAGLSIDAGDPRLFCFPVGADGWQLHHAAPYAVVRWTNIFDPARLIFLGDIISGAVAPAFGPGIVDVDLRTLRGQSWRFTHTRYWSQAPAGARPPPHLTELRTALDLAGQRRPL